MENIAIKNVQEFEIRIIEKAFQVNDEIHDLILKKSGEIFSIFIKDTQGRIHFHEQEIAEQLGVSKPNIDHLIEFILSIYTIGLNLRKARDLQIKILVEGCPNLFPAQTEKAYM